MIRIDYLNLANELIIKKHDDFISEKDKITVSKGKQSIEELYNNNKDKTLEKFELIKNTLIKDKDY